MSKPINNPIRVFLWSGPRNISTTLMYSFAQRPDTRVFDEPLYGWYLAESDAAAYHPGVEQILGTMEQSGEKVIGHMLSEASKPVLFFKNMAHHLLHLDRTFMRAGVNLILTRDPKEMLLSFSKVIAKPQMKDVGYQSQVQLVDDLLGMGIKPIVLDSKKVLQDPEGMLRKLCAAIGIPFDRAMLSWPEGPRPEDGVWAKYWYDSIHHSTGFKNYEPKNEELPKELYKLHEECLMHYHKLNAYELSN